MADKVFFALREFCEVYALKTIIGYCRELSLGFHWNILSFPVNTDFGYCSLSKAFSEIPEVSVIEHFDEAFLSQIRLFGFATDMRHDLDGYMREQFSCSEVASCRLYRRPISQSDHPLVVVGNVKVKSPVEDFQSEIFWRLARLPYDVAVVPRHPLNLDEMKAVHIPSSIRFINTMGELEGLHSRADLVVMGRIFSADGLKPDDDHNPLEATINAHALCGLLHEVPKPYRWFYEDSGLLHQCSTLEEVYEGIDLWMRDTDLPGKLAKRDEWIQSNRSRYLGEIVKTLQVRSGERS